MNRSLFGALVTWSGQDNQHCNGLQKANQDFLKATIRYSNFHELHFFLNTGEIESFTEAWGAFIERYGAGKTIKIRPVVELPTCFGQHRYSVFHCGDPYIDNLVKLREHHAPKLFPITGRAHTLSDDPQFSRVRDLLFAPVKSCDAILCSSFAQQKVMERLLSAASANLSHLLGISVPYKGKVAMLPLGVELLGSGYAENEKVVGPLEPVMKTEVRKQLGLKTSGPMMICLGRLSPSDKMDIYPLLLVLNDVLEEGWVDDALLVIAGAGDAGSDYVQQLMRQAYELNLEDHIRFEISIPEERKQWLLAASDVFISLADNVQESFGLAPVEAMQYEIPVVLSDWNGYRELIEDGVSGYLIPTLSGDVDHLSRSMSLLNKEHASFIQSQSTSFDGVALAGVLEQLLNNKGLRQKIGAEGRARAESLFSWPTLIHQYHELVVTLNNEVTRFRHRPGRATGMPYQRVFGHYPSIVIKPEHLLKTTDRGLRVLLYSEQTVAYRELLHLQGKAITGALLKGALRGATVADLIHATDGDESAQFVIARLIKLQLLEKTQSMFQPGQGSAASIIRRLPVDTDSRTLNYPEPGRAALIKPVVSCFLSLLEKDHRLSTGVISGIGQMAIEWFDAKSLQAIGWFGEQCAISHYGEVISRLEKEGGLNHLLQTYPLWARNCRITFFKYLKVLKQLLSRFEHDREEINNLFFAKHPAKALTGLVPLLKGEDEHPVYLLQLDNGEKLVYKTRNLSCARAVCGESDSLIGLVNRWLDGFATLGTYKVLPKNDIRQFSYGYVEYIESTTPEDIGTYHLNLGVLSGLCLMLGLCDVNHSNVLIRNNVPYIVDPEMMFHGSVLQQLERELSNPGVAFVRGINASSFECTGLRTIWENFATYQSRLCGYTLDNGHIVPAEQERITLVANHLYTIDDKSILDSPPESCFGRYADAFTSGFERFFSVLVLHLNEWQQNLRGLQGVEVRYSPILDVNAIRRVLRDAFTEMPLQQVSHEGVERYFSRMATRITQAGQSSQRWLEPQWQEPLAELSASYSGGWRKLEQGFFVYNAGERQLFSRNYHGNRQPVSTSDYFAGHNYFNKAIELSERIAGDEAALQDFLVAYKEAFLHWFHHDCKPGVELPEALRVQALSMHGSPENG